MRLRLVLLGVLLLAVLIGGKNAEAANAVGGGHLVVIAR
jgi:hypothetical protein